MKAWLSAWALKPAERLFLLLLFALMLMALAVPCRRLRTEQPEAVDPPEGVAAPIGGRGVRAGHREE